VKPRPAAESATVLCVVMEVQHSNNAGFVHGGSIMRLADSAAGTAAAKHCHRRVVTAAMDDMSFLTPVNVGDLLFVKATVNDAYRTSMEIGVRVEAQTIPDGEVRHVSSAHLVFVALDEQGKPTPVPPVLAQTEVEKMRQAHARKRRELRKATRATEPAG
jgi:acyl-CoA hydrolase